MVSAPAYFAQWAKVDFTTPRRNRTSSSSAQPVHPPPPWDVPRPPRPMPPTTCLSWTGRGALAPCALRAPLDPAHRALDSPASCHRSIANRRREYSLYGAAVPTLPCVQRGGSLVSSDADTLRSGGVVGLWDVFAHCQHRGPKSPDRPATHRAMPALPPGRCRRHRLHSCCRGGYVGHVEPIHVAQLLGATCESLL